MALKLYPFYSEKYYTLYLRKVNGQPNNSFKLLTSNMKQPSTLAVYLAFVLVDIY